MDLHTSSGMSKMWKPELSRHTDNAAASDPQMLDMAKSSQEEHIAPLSRLPQMATMQASMVCVAILLVQAIVLPALDWAAAPDFESCVDGVSERMKRVRIAQGVHWSALLPPPNFHRHSGNRGQLEAALAPVNVRATFTPACRSISPRLHCVRTERLPAHSLAVSPLTI